MSISFTYTFSPTAVIYSAEHNTNNTDLRNAIRSAHHQDADGTLLVNADISGSAEIAYSKLNLTNTILNADINSSANIAESKINFNTTSGHDHDGSDSKKIPAISSTYFGNLSGANLTSLAGAQVTGLDWDNCWSDAVHSHASSGEGGNLDWDTCWSDAVHSHGSAGEGGTLSGYFSTTGDNTTTGYIYAARFRTTATAGGGYYELKNQSSTPSTPGSGLVKMFTDGSDNLVFRRDDGQSASINLSTGSITTWH